MRLLGARQGVAVTGALGGLASSTAVTFGLSQKAREAADALAKYFALGIVIASTIMFLRQLLLTFVIDPSLARALILPVTLPVVIGAGAGIYLWRQKGAAAGGRTAGEEPHGAGERHQVWTGLRRGAVCLARGLSILWRFRRLRGRGACGPGGCGRLHDFRGGPGPAGGAGARHGGRLDSAGGAMNTLVKGGIAAVLGGPALRRVILPIFAAMALGAIVACIVVARS